jgi:hypothetical protein
MINEYYNKETNDTVLISTGFNFGAFFLGGIWFAVKINRLNY